MGGPVTLAEERLRRLVEIRDAHRDIPVLLRAHSRSLLAPPRGGRNRKTRDRKVTAPEVSSPRMRPASDEPDQSDGWRDLLLRLPREANPAGLFARAALLFLLGLWTLLFLRHGMNAAYLMRSFLHLVDLPFHEAGHILLAPFGHFLSVLGGSLFQVAIPLLCGGVLLFKTRDPFAASVTLWWAGQSLMDLAPYIADARALRLPLLGGRTGAEVEGHDWEYLLAALGLTRHDLMLGKLSFALGALAMLGALAWGGTVLWRLRSRLRAS